MFLKIAGTVFKLYQVLVIQKKSETYAYVYMSFLLVIYIKSETYDYVYLILLYKRTDFFVIQIAVISFTKI